MPCFHICCSLEAILINIQNVCSMGKQEKNALLSYLLLTNYSLQEYIHLKETSLGQMLSVML